MNDTKRFSNNSIFFTLILIAISKAFLFLLIKNGAISLDLGGGSDAEYYNGYALGFYDIAVNSWPIILRYLNNFDLYSREVISYLFLFMNIVLIPILTCKIAGITFKKNQKLYLYCFAIILIYPTLYFLSLDIYRDILMAFSFLIGCLVVKKSLHSNIFLCFIFYFSVSIVIGFFLLGLRPYLGYAFLLALFLWKIKFTKKRLVFLAVLYFSALFFVNYLGYLNFLTDYRLGFEEGGGGSTLGLNFSNPIMFIPNFVLSTFGQLFGLYITNPFAIMLLLIETVPFFFMFVYVIKNIKWADSFVRFLIIFFVLYGSVWLIGNDNLGTAVRLRIYNYLAIYISFFYILRLKSQSLREQRC